MRELGYAAEIDNGRRFIQSIRPDEIVALIFHGDAGSICSAAILTRTLRQLGDELVYPVYLRKGESPDAPDLGRRASSKRPSRLIAVGLCGIVDPIVPEVRTMIVDDHRQEEMPSVECYISSYDTDPPSPLPLLTYEMCKGLLLYNGSSWLSALGIAARLGVKSNFEILDSAREQYGQHVIADVVDLLDAGRESSEFDLESVYEVLMEADSPTDISNLAVPGSDRLRRLRSEVEFEFRRVMEGDLYTTGTIALMKYASPAMIERRVADAVAEDVPDRISVAANYGYIEGEVSFAIGQVHPPVRAMVREALKGCASEESSGGMICGRAKSTEFERLLDLLGRPAQVH